MATTIGRHERKKRREERRKLKEEVNRRRRFKTNKISTTRKMKMMTSTNTPPPPPPLNPPPPPPPRCSTLPHHLVLDNILSRLPVKSLIRFSCVCKLWNISLSGRDPHFHSTHFLRSQENPILMFHFFNVGWRTSPFIEDQYFFYLKKEDAAVMISKGEIKKKKDGHGAVRLRILATPRNNRLHAPVGYCNGLVCLSWVFSKRRIIQFYNPSSREILTTFPPIDALQSIQGYGFGFDSLTKEYKVVCIVKRLKCCHVYTLGSRSWRKITGPGPRTYLSRCYHPKSAVFCNGALYWRSYNNPLKILSFDIHSEKFHFIQIPVKWFWIENHHPEQQIIWARLLEFKGSLCIACIEKIESRDNQNKNCNKVHLHILKDDKIKQQVWSMETFFLPFTCDLVPTRIVAFSDQILLFWFYGECFEFYNLHTQVSKVVKFPGGHFLEKKHRRGLRHPATTDFQLFSYVANFLSLRTFLPSQEEDNNRGLEETQWTHCFSKFRKPRYNK